MKALYVPTFALAGTVAAWGAVILGSQAADMPLARAAEEKALPLVAMVAFAGTSLFCAAAAATDSQ